MNVTADSVKGSAVFPFHRWLKDMVISSCLRMSYPNVSKQLKHPGTNIANQMIGYLYKINLEQNCVRIARAEHTGLLSY